MASNQQPTIGEAIDKMRSEIILTFAKSQQSALNGYDVLVNQLKNYNNAAIELRKEITRLQELCEKNKIEYKIAPEIPKPEITNQQAPKIEVAKPETTSPKK
jgi:hypothetical protein